MGVLQRFEKRLSGLVEGGFARLFHGRVEPVELAAALAREADTNKAVGPQRVLVPNIYAVALSRADYERLAPYALTLGDELATMVSEHAAEQGYTFIGPVNVALRQQRNLATGAFRIESRVEAARDLPSGPTPAARRPRPESPFPPARGFDTDLPGVPPAAQPAAVPPVPSVPSVRSASDPLEAQSAGVAAAPQPEPEEPPVAETTPVLDPAAAGPNATTVLPAHPSPPPRGRLELPDGREVQLRLETTILGRGTDADVRIPDASVSRRHAAVSVVGRAVVVEDLGSTNGLLLNGHKIHRETLADGDELRLGSATVRYRS